MYKRMYLFAHMRTLNNENFANADYKVLIAQLRSLIDSSVQADPNFLYTYTQYQQPHNHRERGRRRAGRHLRRL